MLELPKNQRPCYRLQISRARILGRPTKRSPRFTETAILLDEARSKEARRTCAVSHAGDESEVVGPFEVSVVAIWEFRKNGGGVLFWGPCNQSPCFLGEGPY